MVRFDVLPRFHGVLSVIQTSVQTSRASRVVAKCYTLQISCLPRPEHTEDNGIALRDEAMTKENSLSLMGPLVDVVILKYHVCRRIENSGRFCAEVLISGSECDCRINEGV